MAGQSGTVGVAPGKVPALKAKLEEFKTASGAREINVTDEKDGDLIKVLIFADTEDQVNKAKALITAL